MYFVNLILIGCQNLMQVEYCVHVFKYIQNPCMPIIWKAWSEFIALLTHPLPAPPAWSNPTLSPLPAPQTDAVYGSQRRWWMRPTNTHPDEVPSLRYTKSLLTRGASYDVAPTTGDVIFGRREDEFQSGEDERDELEEIFVTNVFLRKQIIDFKCRYLLLYGAAVAKTFVRPPPPKKRGKTVS